MITITPPKFALVHYIDEVLINEITRDVTYNKSFKVLNVSDSRDRCLEVMLDHRLNNVKEIKDSEGKVIKRIYNRMREYQLYKLDKIPCNYYDMDIEDTDIQFE